LRCKAIEWQACALPALFFYVSQLPSDKPPLPLLFSSALLGESPECGKLRGGEGELERVTRKTGRGYSRPV